MGSSESKGKVISTKIAPPPPPGPPYPGPSLEYFFLNVEVAISAEVNFFGKSLVTTDINNYYPLLAGKCAEGFRLLTFYGIPDVARTQGFSLVPTVLRPFQGIFCRPSGAAAPEPCQLKVEKSMLVTQNIHQGIISFSMTHGQVSDTTHLFQAIANNTQDGSRLICLEMTGNLRGQNFSAAIRGVSPVMGVDLFFEVPTRPTMERHIYQCVPIAINVHYSFSFGSGGIHVECDWQGHLAHYLSQGWRLVEIFMDKSIHHRQQGIASIDQALNAIWFFEKPSSCVDNPTPVYQGMVVDHWYTIKGGFTGSRAKTDWELTIQQLGSEGWELACILETPEFQQSGLTSVKKKVLLFFQRRILPPLGSTSGGPDTFYSPSGQELPPSYGEACKN